MINTVEYKKLISLLDEAAKLAGQLKGGYSNHYLSVEEFYIDLNFTIQQIKAGEIEKFYALQSWFRPTCDWDDLTGIEGVSLGNEIYDLLCQMKNDQ